MPKSHVSVAFAFLAAQSCVEFGVGGFPGEVQAPVEDVWATAGESLSAYGITLVPLASGRSRSEFRVADADFLVEIGPAQDGTATEVFVGCDCPWPATRELLDAVLDDQEAIGRTVTRPVYPTDSTPSQGPELDELRRRRGR